MGERGRVERSRALFGNRAAFSWEEEVMVRLQRIKTSILRVLSLRCMRVYWRC